MNTPQLVLHGLLLIISKSEAASQGDDESSNVIFVNVLYRHGYKTPMEFYPNDPYQDKSYWPEGIGQLTNIGTRQVFELGQWLRRRYDVLLTDHYRPDIVHVQSTEKDKKLMSAQCLAGMFPPKEVKEWSDDLAWQPVPVQKTPKALKKVLAQPPRTPCPVYDQELHKVFTSDENIRELNQTYSELLNWTNKNSGKNYTLLNLDSVYNVLLLEKRNNLTLPDWTKRVFPELMQEVVVHNYRLQTWTPKLARLKIGLLLNGMIQNMLNKVENQSTKNIHIYSGDDDTIVSLLNSLGAFNHVLPPHAACVVMELRVDSSGKHYVSLYYRNSTSNGPYLLTVEGCAPPCPLGTFLDITRPLIPDDWERECTAGEDVNWMLIFGVASLVVILVEPVIYCYYLQKGP